MPAEHSKLSKDEKLELKKRHKKENAGGGDGDKKQQCFIESAVCKAVKEAISEEKGEEKEEDDTDEPARKISKTQTSSGKDKASKKEPPKTGEDDAMEADSAKDDLAASQFGRFAHKLKCKEKK